MKMQTLGYYSNKTCNGGSNEGLIMQSCSLFFVRSLIMTVGKIDTVYA